MLKQWVSLLQKGTDLFKGNPEEKGVNIYRKLSLTCRWLTRIALRLWPVFGEDEATADDGDGEGALYCTI